MFTMNDDFVIQTQAHKNKAHCKPLFKNRIFKLFHLLSKYQSSISSKILHFFTVIQCLQIIGIVFLPKCSDDSENQTFYTGMVYISKALLLYPFISYADTSLLILVIAILNFFGICLLIMVLYIFLKSFKKYFKTLLYISTYCMIMMTGVLYMPILGILYTGMDCEGESSYCFQNTNLATFIIGIVSAFLLFIVSLIFKIFIFNPHLSHNDPTAFFNTRPILLMHIFRTFAITIQFFAQSQASESVTVFLIFALLFIYCIIQKQTLDCYNILTMKFLVIFARISFLASFAVVLIHVYELQSDFVTFSGLILCGIGVALLSLLVWNDPFELIISGQDTEDCLTNACLSMLLLEFQIHESKSRTNAQHLSSFFAKHISKCTNVCCPITRIYDNNQVNPYKNYNEMLTALLFVINISLKKVVSQYPKFVSAKILYMFVILDKLGYNYILAWELYKHSKCLQLSLIDQYKLYDIKKTLAKSSKQASNVKNIVDPLAILHKIKLERKFRHSLENNTLLYSQFWDILQEQSPDFQKFMKTGKNILQGNITINKKWELLSNLQCGISLHITYQYFNYCKKVKIDETKLKQIEEKFNSASILDSGNMLMQYMGQGDGVIAVSGTAESLGKMVQVNCAFCEFIEYPKEFLIMKNITNLVPNLFKNYHSNAFEYECFMLEGGQRRKYDDKEGFFVKKSGYILPVTTKIVESPSVLNTYSFIGRVRPNKSIKEFNIVHLLTDPNGTIENITENANYFLHITLELLRENKIQIQKIVHEIFDLPREIMNKIYCSPLGTDKKIIVGCQYKLLKTSKGDKIGYHVILMFDMENLIFKRSQSRKSSMIIDNYNYQFHYSQSQNGYYMTTIDEKKYNNSSRKSGFDDEKPDAICLTGREIYIAKNTKQDINTERDNELPAFYEKLLPFVEEICKTLEDFSLLKSLKSHKKLDTDIVTYRWSNDENRFVKATSQTNINGISKQALLLSDDEYERTRKDDNKDNSELLQVTLKNKEDTQKLLKGIPMPRGFFTLILICVLSLFITIIVAIVQYMLYGTLFTVMKTDYQVFSYIPTQYMIVSDACRYVLQAACVVQYFSN